MFSNIFFGRKPLHKPLRFFVENELIKHKLFLSIFEKKLPNQ